MAAADAISTAPKPPLRVLLCSPRGFCAGVVRAIDSVERALALYGAPVYVRHEIVHNRYVVEGLRAKGAVFVEELDEIPDTDAPVIFSAHGVPQSVPAEAAAAEFPGARRHLSAGHQGASRGRDPPAPRARDFADRPCRASRGGRHARPASRRRRDPDRDDCRCGCFHPARSGAACLCDADHAVDRRYRGDRRAAEGALSADRRPAQGRHLLRHHQPPGRR